MKQNKGNGLAVLISKQLKTIKSDMHPYDTEEQLRPKPKSGLLFIKFHVIFLIYFLDQQSAEKDILSFHFFRYQK